ncbi:unnamed protein product, partial [marine sediment metagenome]
MNENKAKDWLKNILELLNRYEEIEFEDLNIDAGDLEIIIRPGAPAVAVPPAIPAAPPKPTELTEVEFHPPIGKYPGQIAEVTLGATRAEGGTRGKTITMGGERIPPFHLFEGSQPHPPVIAGDVFDTPISLPGPVRECLGDAIQDPLKWAKLSVDKFGADLIDLE